jgi:hypothetical protein
MRLSTQYTEINAAITSALADVAVYDVSQTGYIAVQVTNNGAAALSGFEFRGRVIGPLSRSHVMLRNSNFTTADLHVMFASADLATLAAGASAIVYLNVGMLESVKFKASSAAPTSITIAVGAYEE